MINTELADKFIDKIIRYTEYNVNIMNEEGIIIASRDKERIGQFHEIAWQIVHGSQDIVDTTGMNGELSEEMKGMENVRPGINMVIEIDGIREGVVGVTGDPDEIRPVAMMTKMALETMVRFERQQEQTRLRENRKEHFVHLLTEVEASDQGEVRELAASLGYPEEMIRIPILVRLYDQDTKKFLSMLRHVPNHTNKDFSIAPDERHVIVFKTMPDERMSLFENYKYIIGEYLSPILQWMQKQEVKGTFYVGSFQDTYSRYYYAYRHCKWLEANIRTESRAVYFYDHLREYSHSLIPAQENQRIFSLYESYFPSQKIPALIETVGALIAENYNFSTAAKSLFIHKNTLVYRYNQLKELMNIDPLVSSADRAFLEAFYYYLLNKK